jgi:hypothetical protein
VWEDINSISRIYGVTDQNYIQSDYKMSNYEQRDATKTSTLTKFETLSTNEPTVIQSIESIIKRQMEKDYEAGNTKRGSQPA